eukprot:gb/GEZN01014243.1/.p1 GENE.gb/GEZN01014243.1/~~gb/GEZN01014243.1/.p1  ORF type:complete len:279 (-),score=44.91 gb/GEZN01014243.1/:126-962(-)
MSKLGCGSAAVSCFSCAASSSSAKTALVSPFASIASAKKKRRVLCLHGFRTSGEVLKWQLSFLLKRLHEKSGTHWEFSYLDAPLPASGTTDAMIMEIFGTGPYYEWWNAEKKGEEMVYRGSTATITYVKAYLDKHGPFDALLGFSQGAAVVSVLSALNASQGWHRTHPRRQWTFDVLMCGVPAAASEFKSLFVEPLCTPSLHVLDRMDPVKSRSEELYEVYAGGRRHRVEKNEGHFPPRRRDVNDEIVRLFSVMSGEIKTTSDASQKMDDGTRGGEFG